MLYSVGNMDVANFCAVMDTLRRSRWVTNDQPHVQYMSQKYSKQQCQW